MLESDRKDLEYALRNLRHLYEQMIKPGLIKDQASAARGLLGPAISLLEKIKDKP